MRSLQPSQRAAGRVSDAAACGRARRTAPFAVGCACAAVWLAWLPAALAASEGDPLHSIECAHARGELEAALAAPDARNGARLARARHAARQACLGSDRGTRQRTGAPDPPQVVPAPALPRLPPEAAAPPLPPVPAPPLPVPRATAITTCDPAGCWDSEGRRLNQMGPQLVGPRGVCTVQGNVVTCP